MILNNIDLNVVLNSREKILWPISMLEPSKNGLRLFMGFHGVKIHGSGGRKDLSDTAKWSQWPYLSKSYEATCTTKFLLKFEEIA